MKVARRSEAEIKWDYIIDMLDGCIRRCRNTAGIYKGSSVRKYWNIYLNGKLVAKRQNKNECMEYMGVSATSLNNYLDGKNSKVKELGYRLEEV